MPAVRSQSLPMFRSEDEEVNLTRPISSWAVLSLVIGLSCLLVPISVKLIPLSILAVALGLILSIRLSRPDADAGLWMSLACLALGAASAVWCITAQKARANHYSHHATQFAKEYLQLLSSGQYYNAVELRLPFEQRQTSDVDLGAFYETYKGVVETRLDLLGSAPDEQPDPAKTRKTALERLKIDPVSTYVRQYSDTEWNSLGVKEVIDDRKVVAVKVLMQSQSDPSTRVIVELMRGRSEDSGSENYAQWRVSNQELEEGDGRKS